MNEPHYLAYVNGVEVDVVHFVPAINRACDFGRATESRTVYSLFRVEPDGTYTLVAQSAAITLQGS